MWLALGSDASLIVGCCGVITVRVVTLYHWFPCSYYIATPITDLAITALAAINPVRYVTTSTTMALAGYATTSVAIILASYATISIAIIATNTQLCLLL